jgi:hypothetical protein
MTGSDINCCCSPLKVCCASLGSGQYLYPESFLVTLKRGAAMTAKSLMCVLKKLQSPTKDLTILMFVGGLVEHLGWLAVYSYQV